VLLTQVISRFRLTMLMTLIFVLVQMIKDIVYLIIYIKELMERTLNLRNGVRLDTLQLGNFANILRFEKYFLTIIWKFNIFLISLQYEIQNREF